MLITKPDQANAVAVNGHALTEPDEAISVERIEHASDCACKWCRDARDYEPPAPAYATTNEAMLARLHLICDELYQYAYGHREDGERFQGWEEIGQAYVALEWLFPIAEREAGSNERRDQARRIYLAIRSRLHQRCSRSGNV